MYYLFGNLPSIIERNVSVERLTELKRNSMALIADVAEQLHNLVPEPSLTAHAVLLSASDTADDRVVAASESSTCSHPRARTIGNAPVAPCPRSRLRGGAGITAG